MKVCNKKTGEIAEAIINTRGICVSKGGICVNNQDGVFKFYKSLADLCEEWEDYEEQKEYWYIDWNGEVCHSDIHDERTNQMELIGNKFETKEEAEKAVEKLKAWQRLKDKGFKFVEHQIHGVTEDGEGDGCVYFEFNELECSDLELLFGGDKENNI